MKSLSTCLICIMLLAIAACHKKTTDLSPVPEYQTAIERKSNTLNWTSEGYSKSGSIVATKGKKGWVQYYASSAYKRAIYYYSGTGAFGFSEYETKKYDELGQDTFAGTANDYPLGRPVADSKPCGEGCTFVQFENGIIIAPHFIMLENSYMSGFTVTVYGSIYAKYKSLGLWNSPLGYPVSDEMAGTGSASNVRANSFVKTAKDLSSSANFIYYTQSTDAQAIWGLVCKAYRTSPASGWLGYPTTSCDPARADNAQKVSFQSGRMEMNGNCAVFYNKNNVKVTSYNTLPSGTYLCY